MPTVLRRVNVTTKVQLTNLRVEEGLATRESLSPLDRSR